ncbi:unnamed protein product [Litomosoides sigmodontis]|uniref:Uncharacterized protein n=1 Tax=Litomosoides sigmodontis TaxID=42156 RepID=A0A3P6SEP0_LITSI|nr:unnamed protein product [Litomosoides sigmodontis]
MAVRNSYSLYDERLMWEYIFERLQSGDEVALKPKGLKLWKKFEATQKTNKTASSLATHFRKAMYDHIEEAKIPVEQQLYIASQLDLQLSRRQQKMIEYKENISITTNDFGIVTKYEKGGGDDDINDELGYDAFELNGSVSKIARLSVGSNKNPSTVPCSGHYNLRKRINTENSRLHEIRNCKATEAIDFEHNNRDCNADQNEDCNDVGDENETFHVRRLSDDEEESGREQREVCDNTEVSTYGKQLFSNEINGRGTSKSKKTFCVEDELRGDLKENNMNMSCSKNETSTVVFPNEVLRNQVGTEVMPNGNLKTAACNSTLTITSEKGKQESPVFESIIDDELKQLVAYILNKRQLKGVEKMKMEKILELRAKEAKRFGSDLKSYLRKLQQQMI